MLSNPIAKTDLITQDGFSDDWKALGVKYEAREMFELEELWRVCGHTAFNLCLLCLAI